jgi:hypothetical protein
MTTLITLPHPVIDVDGKTIRYRIRSYKGDPIEELIASGQGTLTIRSSNEDDKFFASIDITVWPVSGVGTVVITELPLDQRSVDYIRILPTPEGNVELECLDSSLPCD